MTALADTAPSALTPGVHDGIPEDIYHADPVPGGSLSSSGARRLLATCPAIFHWEQDHGTPPKRAWDLGTAAHKLVLGAGPDLAIIDAKDYRTKAAQTDRDAARAAGTVPLLTHEHEQVQAMAAALRRHPIASALLDPDRGRPEQTLIWEDPDVGVRRRARLDWMPHPAPGRRLIIADYKTTTNAHPDAIRRAVHDHGYHQQGAWYSDGVTALGIAEDPAFLLIFQEKTPPYVVVVAEIDRPSLAAGHRRNQRALALFAECQRTGEWPGYADHDIPLITLPPWAREDSQ